MDITIYAGGQSWIVDENILLNWLAQHAIQPERKRTVVKEIVDDKESGRVLLTEEMIALAEPYRQ